MDKVYCDIWNHEGHKERRRRLGPKIKIVGDNCYLCRADRAIERVVEAQGRYRWVTDVGVAKNLLWEAKMSSLWSPREGATYVDEANRFIAENPDKAYCQDGKWYCNFA